MVFPFQRSRPSTVDQRTMVLDVIASGVDEGEVRLNIGYTSRSNKGIGAGAPCWWGADGFVSVPNDPSDDGACMVWMVQDGNDKRILGYRDNRFADKLATLQPGDRGILTDGEARFIIRKGEDSVSLYSVDQSTDTDMIMTLNGKEGFGEMRVGATSIKVSNDKITMVVAGGKTIVTIDDQGFQVDGNTCRLATQSGHLGSLAPTIPAVPPPVGISSIVAGPTGVAGVGSTKWTVSV
jgi:hypothetical protein